MNITPIASSPKFAGLYVEYDGMNQNTKKAASSLARQIEYTDEVTELDKKNIDVFILPHKSNSKKIKPENQVQARVYVADRTNKAYRIGEKNEAYIPVLDSFDGAGNKFVDKYNFSSTKAALDKVLNGEAKKNTARQKEILCFFPRRDTGIIDTEYKKSSPIEFDDDNVWEDEYRECEELCRLYLEA